MRTACSRIGALLLYSLKSLTSASIHQVQLALTLQEGDGYVNYFLKPDSMYQVNANVNIRTASAWQFQR